MIAMMRGLMSLGMNGLVIFNGKPGGKGAIELIEGENIAGPDLGFKLRLNGFEKAFDDAAAGRIGFGAISDTNIEDGASGLETERLKDLGEIEI